MKTNQDLKKKLSLSKTTVSDLGNEDMEKIKGGGWSDICVYSDMSECTNLYIQCC